MDDNQKNQKTTTKDRSTRSQKSKNTKKAKNKSEYEKRFEEGLHALIMHFVHEATGELQSTIEHLQSRWPIVGTPNVLEVRRAVRDQVALWFERDISDFLLKNLGTDENGRARHIAARYAAHNVLYRAMEHEFQVSELKALPEAEVDAALQFVVAQTVPIETMVRAVERKAIRQRVQEWIDEGVLQDTPSARQGTRQILWNLVKRSGLDPTTRAVARRGRLAIIDGAAVPERYRVSQ